MKQQLEQAQKAIRDAALWIARAQEAEKALADFQRLSRDAASARATRPRFRITSASSRIRRGLCFGRIGLVHRESMWIPSAARPSRVAAAARPARLKRWSFGLLECRAARLEWRRIKHELEEAARARRRATCSGRRQASRRRRRGPRRPSNECKNKQDSSSSRRRNIAGETAVVMPAKDDTPRASRAESTTSRGSSRPVKLGESHVRSC